MESLQPNPQSMVDLHLDPPASLTNFLQDLLQKDTYNKFCIDCNRNESTHASITYGVFVCEECANSHLKEFGMDKSYIKSVTGEMWDPYQIRVIQLGGNKNLWDFLKLYNGLEQKPIAAKYKSNAAAYYRRRLAAQAVGLPFTEKQPPRNAEEFLEKGVDGAKSVALKAGEGIVSIGQSIGGKIESSGIKDKFKGLFAKKETK